MPNRDYFISMLLCGSLTIMIETVVLVFWLSRRHARRVRIFAGVWLTLCTYPVVWLVLPPLFHADQRSWYLLVAETFAPLAEAILFWLAFSRRLPRDPLATARDTWAIVVANLCSFGLGEVLRAYEWLAAHSPFLRL